MAILILGMLAVGFIMADMPPSDQKWVLYMYHKSTGTLVLGLAVLRLVWKFINIKPALPENLIPLHRFLAEASVPVLYLMMFIMPLSGFIMSDAFGKPVNFLNLYQFPSFIGPNKTIATTAAMVHYIAAFIFCGLILIHFLAALFHHFILKDTVLKRMLPFVKK
jgi:cytochrome b561